MIQYLHKINHELIENVQCIITIGEEREKFKMILSHQQGNMHEEIQCYGKIDNIYDNYDQTMLIVDKIYKMNFGSSYTNELHLYNMENEKLHFVLEKLPTKQKIDDTCHEYGLMKQGANININEEYDTILYFMNYDIPIECNDHEIDVLEKIYCLKNKKFIQL